MPGAAFSVNGIWYNTTSISTVYVDVTGGSAYTGNIVIPTTIVYSGTTYTVTSIRSSAFKNCTGITSISLPSTLATIGFSSFQGCTGLSTIAIPASVTSIDGSAFKNCTGLTSFYAYPTTPPTFSDNVNLALSGVKTATTCKLYVPTSSLSLYQTTSQWDSFATIVGLQISVSGTSNLSSLSGVNSASDITITSGGTLNIDASSTVNSIIATPGAKITLIDTKTISANSIVIQSDATGTATFVDQNTSGTNVTATVQQYLSSTRNWYISSPVANATTPANYTIYSYHEPGDNTNYASQSGSPSLYWESMTQGSTFELAKGYIALPSSNPVTLSFSGTLNSGNVTTGSLTRTTNANKQGFNLVGNPYVSYLDLTTLDTTKVWGSYWMRSKNSSGTAYDFDTYNLTTGLGISKSGKSVTNFIPPMQAFWIRVKEGQSPATLTFTNAMRQHINNSNNMFRAPASNITQQVLYLQVSNGINTDETILAFNPNASNSSDAYDSPKMSINSPLIPEIYTLIGEEQFAINGMNSVPFNSEIPIGFTTSQAGNFIIKASQITNFDVGTQIMLKDYTDLSHPVITDLSDGSVYTFTSAITNNTTRFTLIFKAPSTTTGVDTSSKDNLWISTNINGQIIVNGVIEGKSTISVYNENGQCVATQQLTSTNNCFDNRLVAGVYFVSLNVAGLKKTQKIIIN